ncbi:MAG: ABC transporter ATP-binding protein [Coprothermobacterota bacterium]|nr:ABC transporter ATP-binding protein [Coprothermobacterota bacterium]
MKMEAIQLSELYKIYKDGDRETVALRGASLTVQPGEFVAITGRSGAGKSTLLSLMGGLALPSAGRVVIGGTDIAKLVESERAAFRRETIGIIYQADNLIPFLTAFENVMLPLQLARARNTSRRAHDLLKEVGLSERLRHKPAMLSGGERQRVAIAVALANQPKILLADELTGELDSATADQVMELLDRLNVAHGLTLIVVTHNKNVAARARRWVSIADGQLYESETGYA